MSVTQPSVTQYGSFSAMAVVKLGLSTGVSQIKAHLRKQSHIKMIHFEFKHGGFKALKDLSSS